MKEVQKILIRSANWVGDAVMTLPAMVAVRRNFPQAEISVLAKPWVADLFRNYPSIDRIILYRSPGPHEGLAGKWRLARELNAEGFDLTLLFPNSFESALISFLAGIPRRLGYNTDGRGLLLTSRVPVTTEIKKGHQIDYYLQLVRSLGCQANEEIPVLEIPPITLEKAAGKLRVWGIEDRDCLVGISPGAQYGSAKEWFPERYGEFARRLNQQTGARFLVLGSPKDRGAAREICRSAGQAALDLTGQTSLAEAISLIASCRAFITNDSGLMHVASALRVPLVAIFGSTDPLRTGPRGRTSRVLCKSVDCAPCLKKTCPEQRKCMQEITVDEVLEATKLIMQVPKGSRFCQSSAKLN